MKIFLFILLLIPVLKIKGQVFDSLIIKTHPLRDAVAINPNIEIEKIFNKKFSLELDFTYKNRDTEFSGKDFDIWSYKKSNGFRILLGIKRYFVKSKQIPNAWYLLGQLGFRDVYLTNFNKLDRSGEYYRTVNINKKRIETNILFGREFHIYKNLMTEINLGVGIFWEKYQSQLISGSNNDNRYENGFYKTDYFNPNLFINWTIGYLITKK